MILDDPEHLFDLETVKDEGSRAPTAKFQKTIVSITRPILKDSTIRFKTEKFVRYEEVGEELKQPTPKLNIFKSCGIEDQLSGHSPCMPSLRLEMRDREYDEPIRDRDKDWVLDSQRPIFNEKGQDLVAPKFEIPLGKYKKVETVSKQFWAKEYQTMLRECLLLRHAAIISDTNCIVEIYGVGFTGRLFSEGATSPKLLVIEVYSIWNSQKYMLVLTVMELRLLLVNNPDLLKPGRRADLLDFLLHALFFEYTITIPPRDDPHRIHKPVVAKDESNEDAGAARKSKGTRKSRKQQQQQRHQPDEALHAHVSKEERAAFRHNLQRELALAHQQHHNHALSDAQVEAIIPLNTHHDPAAHIAVHIDHSVPHLQIHFEPAPGGAAEPHNHQHNSHSHGAHEHGYGHGHRHKPEHLHGAVSPNRPASPRHEQAHPHQTQTASGLSVAVKEAHVAGDHEFHINSPHSPLEERRGQIVPDAEHSASASPALSSMQPVQATSSAGELKDFQQNKPACFDESGQEKDLACRNGQGNADTDDLAEAIRALEDQMLEERKEVGLDGPETTDQGDDQTPQQRQDREGDQAAHPHSSPRPDDDASLTPPVDPFITEQMQTVVHLQAPVMPKGYPTTVEQMIRVPPVPPEGSQDPLPVVTQQLHIGAYRRQNGPMLRKQQAVEKRIEEEKEDARLRAIWLATPKRRRNLKGIRLIRRCNYMVLLTGYYDPLRPNTIVLTGTVASEATRMSMYLGLGKIRELLRIDTSVQSWSQDELNVFVTSVLRFSGIIKTDSSDGYAINVAQATGLETALRGRHTVDEFLMAVRARQRPIVSARMHDPDSLSLHYAGYLEVPPGEVAAGALFEARKEDVHDTRPGTAATGAEISRPTTADTAQNGANSPAPKIQEESFLSFAPRSVASASRHRAACWASLGACDSSRAVGETLGTVLRPWREIGKQRRLSSRAVRIHHVHCVYALYADTSQMKNYRRKSIPAWPQLDPNAKNAEEEAALVGEESVGEAESDDDIDFLKAGSDSDDEDSDDSDAGSKAKKKDPKKKKKGKGKSNKKSSKMDSDDLFGDETAEVNIVDEQNDAYASMAEGLLLEFTIYIPHASEYQEHSLPAGSHRMTFTIDELDPIFPSHGEKERIVRALRAVYFCFFETASGEEVRQAEEDWDWFARTLLKRSRWAVRGGLPSRVVTAVSNLHQSNLGIDLLQEMFSAEERRLYVQTLLYSDAEPVVVATGQENILFSNGPSMKIVAPLSIKLPSSLTLTKTAEGEEALVVEDREPFVTLTWPRTVWTKAMKIRSASEERGEFVRLQVTVFQRGETLGVVCFDRERDDVYFAQHPDAALQLSQIQGYRFLSPHERSLQLFIFLTAALTYAETVCQDGVKRGKVTFGAVEEADAVLDSADVIEGDYSAATELLLNNAAGKAQARMKRKT